MSESPVPESHAAAGCSQINDTLDNLFDGSYAGLPPAQSILDLVNNLVGASSDWYAQDVNVPGVSQSLMKAEADINVAGGLLSNLPGNDAYLWTSPAVSGGESDVQQLIDGLNRVQSLCATASTPWTQNLTQIENNLGIA
jgi:hypothetical protein